MTPRRQSTLALLSVVAVVAMAITANTHWSRAQDDSRLKIGGMWLGAELDELKALGLVQTVRESPLLKNGQLGYVDVYHVAHFVDGKAVVLSGNDLRRGSNSLIREDQTRAEVLAVAKREGWSVDKEWGRPTDVAQHHNSIIRFRTPEGVYILVVLFESDFTPDKPPIVSGVYVRNNTVCLPIGDD